LNAVVDIAARTRQRAGRKVLLLISEAQDDGSRAKFQQALEAVERENIEVFAAHYSAYAMSWIARSEDFPDKPELDQMFFRELARIGATNHARALAFATGGNEYSFVSQKALENSISQPGSELYAQYVITFVQRDSSPGLHRIEVAVPGRRDISVRARQAYWTEPTAH
jgi:VWFA-related protein